MTGGRSTDGVDLAVGPAEKYLAGVRAALADLPEAEVAEILDDVAAHLADLGEELGAGAGTAEFTARLGEPAAYAAELRSAGGYPPAPPPAAPVSEAAGTGTARLALLALVGSTVLAGIGGLSLFYGAGLATLLVGALVAALALPHLIRSGPRVAAVAALPVVRGVVASRPQPDSAAGRALAFVASLQPSWWLARAFVAAMLVGLLLGRGTSFQGLVLGLTVVFAVGSIWLGYASRRDRRWLWVVVPLTAFAVALALTGWPGWADRAGYIPADYGEATAGPPVPDDGFYPGLWQDGEREIRDIRPVDANGVPLTGVYLYDQHGLPIDAGGPYCDDGRYAWPPSDPLRPYPRGRTIYDELTGSCVIVEPPTGVRPPVAVTTAPTLPPEDPEPVPDPGVPDTVPPSPTG